jgi:hypothetical protein
MHLHSNSKIDEVYSEISDRYSGHDINCMGIV